MSSTISDPIEEAQQEVKQLLELRELDLAYIANLEGNNESLSKRNAILTGQAALYHAMHIDTTTLVEHEGDHEARLKEEMEKHNCPLCGGSGHRDDVPEELRGYREALAMTKDALKIIARNLQCSPKQVCSSCEDLSDCGDYCGCTYRLIQKALGSI